MTRPPRRCADPGWESLNSHPHPAWRVAVASDRYNEIQVDDRSSLWRNRHAVGLRPMVGRRAASACRREQKQGAKAGSKSRGRRNVLQPDHAPLARMTVATINVFILGDHRRSEDLLDHAGQHQVRHARRHPEHPVRHRRGTRPCETNPTPPMFAAPPLQNCPRSPRSLRSLCFLCALLRERRGALLISQGRSYCFLPRLCVSAVKFFLLLPELLLHPFLRSALAHFEFVC